MDSSSKNGTIVTAGPVLIVDSAPFQYRLARERGEVVLQGLFRWRDEKTQAQGADWQTIPTVDLPAGGAI